MKIALLSAFYPYRGGIAQFGAMLYRSLEQNHEVTAFTFKRQYPGMLFPGTSQMVTEEDKADPIPAMRVLDSIQPFSFGKTAREIRKTEPDILISQYWMTFFGPSFGAVHKKLGKNVKRISILHNVIPHEKRFFDGPANRYFLKQNEAFVVLSDVVLKDLLSIRPDAKYLRIDHPVYSHFGARIPREDALKKLGLSPDNKYLLFFGFIREYKGLDILLESLNVLDSDIQVIVAGETYGSFENYQKLIDAHNLGNRVHLFNQYISDDEVAVYFSASDVCMLPYRSATQSGITAIAHHFEVPIIATDVGGLKEKVKDGENGLIVEKPEAKLISNAIKSYFEEDLTEKFRASIREDNARNTWENFAEKIVEFAQSL